VCFDVTGTSDPKKTMVYLKVYFCSPFSGRQGSPQLDGRTVVPGAKFL
jgi:hypothetical protein